MPNRRFLTEDYINQIPAPQKEQWISDAQIPSLKLRLRPTSRSLVIRKKSPCGFEIKRTVHKICRYRGISDYDIKRAREQAYEIQRRVQEDKNSDSAKALRHMPARDKWRLTIEKISFDDLAKLYYEIIKIQKKYINEQCSSRTSQIKEIFRGVIKVREENCNDYYSDYLTHISPRLGKDIIAYTDPDRIKRALKRIRKTQGEKLSKKLHTYIISMFCCFGEFSKRFRLLFWQLASIADLAEDIYQQIESPGEANKFERYCNYIEPFIGNKYLSDVNFKDVKKCVVNSAVRAGTPTARIVRREIVSLLKYPSAPRKHFRFSMHESFVESWDVYHYNLYQFFDELASIELPESEEVILEVPIEMYEKLNEQLTNESKSIQQALFLRLLFLTSIKPHSLLRAKWSQFEGHVYYATPNRKFFRGMISDTMREILTEIRNYNAKTFRETSEFLFPSIKSPKTGRLSSYKYYWNNICNELALPQCSPDVLAKHFNKLLWPSSLQRMHSEWDKTMTFQM